MSTEAGKKPPTLRDLLEEAEGTSEFIIVVVADIRGFSEFSQRRESPDVAMYIKRVYMRLIDDFFRFGKFYKATGDGLLIAIPYDEKDLQEKAQATVDSCLRCLDEFTRICAGDAMINFSTPTNIGFGIARGTACCLISGDTILDYSGHLLNLASRLTDLARPAGIVLDGAFRIDLLPEETQQRFQSEQVYIRSVAESTPTAVYVLADTVQLADQAKRPLALEHWETIADECTLTEWTARSPRFLYELKSRVKRPDGITVVVNVPLRKVERGHIVDTVLFTDFEYVTRADQPMVRVHVDKLISYLKQRRPRVTRDTAVKLSISYVPE